MTFTDILLGADIPCRPVETPMTLLTIFSSAFLHHLSSCVQVSALFISSLKLHTAVTAFVTFSSPRSLPFQVRDGCISPLSHSSSSFLMDVSYLNSAENVHAINCRTSQHCLCLQERLTSEQLRNFTPNPGKSGGGGGVGGCTWLMRYSEMQCGQLLGPWCG